jgi:hypothetical protein
LPYHTSTEFLFPFCTWTQTAKLRNEEKESGIIGVVIAFS